MHHYRCRSPHGAQAGPTGQAFYDGLSLGKSPEWPISLPGQGPSSVSGPSSGAARGSWPWSLDPDPAPGPDHISWSNLALVRFCLCSGSPSLALLVLVGPGPGFWSVLVLVLVFGHVGTLAPVLILVWSGPGLAGFWFSRLLRVSVLARRTRRYGQFLRHSDQFPHDFTFRPS